MNVRKQPASRWINGFILSITAGFCKIIKMGLSKMAAAAMATFRQPATAGWSGRFPGGIAKSASGCQAVSAGWRTSEPGRFGTLFCLVQRSDFRTFIIDGTLIKRCGLKFENAHCHHDPAPPKTDAALSRSLGCRRIGPRRKVKPIKILSAWCSLVTGNLE